MDKKLWRWFFLGWIHRSNNQKAIPHFSSLFHTLKMLKRPGRRNRSQGLWRDVIAEGYSVSVLHLKDWCWSWNSNTLATWWEELSHLKRPCCWERLRAGGEGDDQGWDGWMGSPTRWTWVWASSGRWWRTGKPGVLQSMGLQRVRQTELLNNSELWICTLPCPRGVRWVLSPLPQALWERSL